MKKTITIIFLLLCAAATQRSMAYTCLAMPDSIAPDPEDEDYYLDTIAKHPRRLATVPNAIDYSLEPRHRPQHDEYRKKWYDRLSLEAGMGFMDIASSSETFKINTLASLRLGVGKTFGHYHTLRLSLTAGTAYEEYSHARFYSLGGKADWLFNITAYSKGYNPTRVFETSFLLGAGAMYTKLQGKPKRLSPEAHAGLQFKFVAGPFGYVTAEPFAGVTLDKMDYSTANWRKYDIFYGINFGFVHYLSDSYAPRHNTDSVRRNPWFVEASAGPAAVSRKGLLTSFLPGKKTMGMQMSWSLGKWFSPIVGMKLSANMSSVHTSRETMSNGFIRNGYTATFSGNIDGLFNPLGFMKRFRWDAPFGAYLLGGMGYGRISLSGPNGFHLRKSFETVSVGAHLFASIDRDLQLFVEPRYERHLYKTGKSLVHDRYATVLVGLTATMRGEKNRRHGLEDEEEYGEIPVTAGLSLSLPVMMMQGRNYSEKGFSYGLKAFGQYRFTGVSSARLSIDYLSLSRAADSPYRETYMSGENLVSRSRSGVMNRRHGLLIATANYCVDVCRLLSGYQGPQRFRAELYFGPGAAFYLFDKATPTSDMEIPEGHEVKGATSRKMTTHFAFTGGVKLSRNVSRHIGIYLEPSLHAVTRFKMQGIQTISYKDNGMQIIPSVSLGAQYTL